MIAALNMMRAERALIVCPAVAKYNWLLNEWPKWTTLHHRTIGVAEGDFWPDTDIVIINYDILPRHKLVIQAVEWDALFVDESHRANNNEARRTIMILGGELKIKKGKREKRSVPEIAESYAATRTARRTYFDIPPIKARKRVFATGTPFNRPKNLWAVCEAFDPNGLGADWEAFHRRYCQAYRDSFGGWDLNGADHQEELGILLKSKFMVRHNADEVLKLPGQQRRFFVLPPVDFIMSSEDEFLKENMEVLAELGDKLGRPVTEKTTRAEFMKIVGDAIIENVVKIGDPTYGAMFTQFAKIRKDTGVAKLPHIIDYVKMRSDDGAIPIVVYGYHKDVMHGLHGAFPDSAFVIGGMTSKARNTEVQRFQDGEVNYFLGNMDAAGENITLTRSNLMVVAELDWRGTQLKQVFMRIKRFTQKRESVVDVLCAAHSFDHVLAENAFNKIKNIDLTLDV